MKNYKKNKFFHIRKILLLSICINIFFGTAIFISAQSDDLKTRPTSAEIESFDLNQVKLLAGPFKHATELNRAYLLKLEPDRLLSWYRKESGLKPKAEVYGGWESRGVAGHSLGHYLSAASLMYRSTGDKQLLERINYIVNELEECQTANGNGYVAAIPEGKRIFAEVANGDIRSQGFDLNGGWVPIYTLHKEFAGLRDAYRLAGNKKALEIAVKLADWFDGVFSKLNYEQMQKVLACEHGGINETLADLYEDTGEKRYLALSQRFHHDAVLKPLAEEKDILQGLHANTQIPKIIGLAARYQLTGDENDRKTAEFFWNRVANHHSYVTGGNGLNEHFGAPDKLNDRLGEHTTESCNVYNMLKLTHELYTLDARAKLGDFYERALFNHILSSQNPNDGRVIYDLTLKMGGRKTYESQFDKFSCCVGSGMENHSKYGSDIYFHTDESLLVNLFIASELDWREKGLKIKQETRIPDEETTRLTFTTPRPIALKLRIRRPYWTNEKLNVSINGKTLKNPSIKNSYIEIERTWNNADTIEIKLPMNLYTEAMPDNPNRVAFKYGPIVLAGDLGADNESSQNELVPAFIDADKDKLKNWLKPVAGQSLTFKTTGVGRPRDVVLKPFFRTHNRRYTVYFDLFTPDQWRQKEDKYKAEQERLRILEENTIDFFQPGEMQPERDHEFRGENVETGAFDDKKWRHAVNGGWFSIVMKTLPQTPLELRVTYWGGDAGNREFDIFADNVKIATQRLENNRPNEFYDEIYVLPADLTKGKNKITIRFQAHPKKMAGGVYGVRLVKK